MKPHEVVVCTHHGEINKILLVDQPDLPLSLSFVFTILKPKANGLLTTACASVGRVLSKP